MSKIPKPLPVSEPVSHHVLNFRAAVKPDHKKAEPKLFRDSLSAIVFAAGQKTVFVGGDETVETEPSIEQLVQENGAYAGHLSWKMSEFVDLPNRKLDDGRIGEIDIEGLAIDGDWLWVIGSHSSNRKKPKDPEEQDGDNLKRLLKVEEGANRFFLARIPLVKDEKTGVKPVKEDSMRRAALVGGTGPDGHLLQALALDDHFRPFFAFFPNHKGEPVRLPSKDNGFDIEGLAVRGDRIFIGMRGPVLRGWACILEVQVKGKPGDQALELAELAASGAGPAPRRYWKHFIDLDGLGVRDLELEGEDLLILAGPTMVLDGPARLYRWEKALSKMAAADTLTLRSGGGPLQILELPEGNGKGHPEGVTATPGQKPGSRQVVVVYDSPDSDADSPFVSGATGAIADVFDL